MKKLTYSSMARARLRANRKMYRNLVISIFLSVYLSTSVTLGIYGIFLGEQASRQRSVGFIDAVAMDNADLTDAQLEKTELFDWIGHCYVLGKVTGKTFYVGYYDPKGLVIRNLIPTQGRLPKAAGEIAATTSALEALELSCVPGDRIELPITPVNGNLDKRVFTLVGLLPEQSEALHHPYGGIEDFPVFVTSSQEPGFATGSLGTHYMMSFREGVTITDALKGMTRAVMDARVGTVYTGDYRSLSCYYCLSFSGRKVATIDSYDFQEQNYYLEMRVRSAAELCIGLLISSGVGIFGAMEGVLAQRQEEIGMLRAVGATRRQIRRIFGRENWLLALTVSPLALGMGCLTAWGLSKAAPHILRFGVAPWLVLPIAGCSSLVILVSGFLPLMQVSRSLPMGMIRDVRMLRRTRKIKMKKRYVPEKLMAIRQLRLNPVRAAGTILLASMMVYSAGQMSVTMNSLVQPTDRSGDITFDSSPQMFQTASIYRPTEQGVTENSLTQLRGLRYVKNVDIRYTIPVTLLLDHVPQYAAADMLRYYRIMDDEMLAQAEQNSLIHAWYGMEEGREEYRAFRERFGIEGCAFDIDICTVKNPDQMGGLVASGSIDMEAIDAGRQVLVVAPEIWCASVELESGTVRIQYFDSETAAKQYNPETAVKLAWNDTFTAGQKLNMSQFWQTEKDGAVERIDRTVTVGAVLFRSTFGMGNHAQFLTTQKGLENLKLQNYGSQFVSVDVDKDIPEGEEAALLQRVKNIASRSGKADVFDSLKGNRELLRQDYQKSLTNIVLTILYFSVAVGMITASVERRINQDGRTIGILRAVGAEGRILTRVYSGQVTVGILTGLVLGTGGGILQAFILFSRYAWWDSNNVHGFLMNSLRRAGGSCVMALVCIVVCRMFVKKKVQNLLHKSIIENIREL